MQGFCNLEMFSQRIEAIFHLTCSRISFLSVVVNKHRPFLEFSSFLELKIKVSRKYCEYLETYVVARVFSANLVSVEVKFRNSRQSLKM